MTQYLTLDSPRPGVGVVRLCRPEVANALNTGLAQALAEYFTRQAPLFRAVVLAGAGKHFCAGADLKERAGMDEAAWEAQHAAFRVARDAILACPVPVIAAVQGAAFAGGLELALACDFIYAASDAKFALTEATLGIMPGMGGTQLLPQRVGQARAREILLTGKPFSAEEAHGWGMVNRLCAPASLMDEATLTASIIADNAPLSVRAIKRITAISLAEGLSRELAEYRALLVTHDRHEGINAWNEKRKAQFTGQ